MVLNIVTAGMAAWHGFQMWEVGKLPEKNNMTDHFELSWNWSLKNHKNKFHLVLHSGKTWELNGQDERTRILHAAEIFFDIRAYSFVYKFASLPIPKNFGTGSADTSYGTLFTENYDLSWPKIVLQWAESIWRYLLDKQSFSKNYKKVVAMTSCKKM